MPPRSSWKGFIKLSLVSVPVKAYTAASSGSEIRMNQLHAECNNRIKYQKVCPEHGEVTKDEIVSGYEFSKGQYVVIDLEELEKLRTESDRSVQINGFIPLTAIDPVYHAGKTQYLVPDGPVGQKPYALLMNSMEKKGLGAIGQIVIAGKEQLVLLRPVEGLLAITVLNYSNRIKKPEGFKDEVVAPELTKEERALTDTLMDASTIADFDFDSYKDEYTEKLTYLIQTKVEGKEIVEVAEPEAPQIINLMEALKESVARAQGDKKMAPSTTSRSASKKASDKKKAPTKRKTG